MIQQDHDHDHSTAGLLDILSEYTDVSVAVNLGKLANWMHAGNEEEFKKLLPSLPVDLVSETNFFLLRISCIIPG